jgi:hypothetical protein
MLARPFARAASVKFGCCLTVALTLVPQPAADPATAAFKAAVNPILATLQEQIQAAKKQFLTDVQAFETAVKGGQLVATEAQNLFVACLTLQAAVTAAGNTAISDVFGAAQDALVALSGGAPLNGVYPKDFYTGTGGQWDKARASVKSKIEKLYPALQGRVKKAASVAASKGSTLTVLLTPPLVRYNYFVSELDGGAFTNQIDIDTLVCVNRTAQAEDGEAWFAGVGAASFGDLTVRILGPENDTVTTTPANFRWNAHATDGGSLFQKGNYIVTVRVDEVTPGDDAAFSFR